MANPNSSPSEIKTLPRLNGNLWRGKSWRLLILPYLLFILIPIVALILRTPLSSLWVNLQSEQVIQALRLSLGTSIISVLVTILIGTPVAYYLSHPHYRLHHLVDTIVDLPTVLPPAVAGVALLMAFGRRGLVGEWFSLLGFSIPFTPLAVIMAQTFIAAPFYIKSAALGFSAVSCELRRAAALDGASRWQVFRFIILPMSVQAFLSGCALTWARAMGEFGATIIFAGNFPGRTQTMPLAIYIGFELDLDVALTLSVIFIAFSFLVLVAVKGFLRKNASEIQSVHEPDW